MCDKASAGTAEQAEATIARLLGNSKYGKADVETSRSASKIEAKIIHVGEISKQGLEKIEGSGSKVAETARLQWITEQNKKLNTWGNIVPSLVEARKAALDAAKGKGENSQEFTSALVSEMARRGFNDTAASYQKTWNDYLTGTTISNYGTRGMQKQALSTVGLSSQPAARDVEGRLKAFREVAQIFAKTETNPKAWKKR